MLREHARLLGRSDIFKNSPSQFLSPWELAESVFCSEELSFLPHNKFFFTTDLQLKLFVVFQSSREISTQK